MKRIHVVTASIVAIVLFAALAYSSPLLAKKTETRFMWLNHFALLPGGSEVTTTFQSTNSGVGGGLTALVVHSSTLGDVFSDGGNKEVQMAVETPGEDLGTNTTIIGVRVCYELTSSASFITQIRLAQVQNPPSVALVLLDDATHLTAPGPVCVNSASTSIDPQAGPLLLSLRVNFGNTSDLIAVRGLGLILSVTV